MLRLCHAGRLDGGLSVSLGALPDEVVGALAWAMGGVAATLRVHDVRGIRPMMLEVKVGDAVEKWEVEGVEGLVHNLNDLYRQDAGVRAVAVLGEWEDMLELWCVPKTARGALLDGRLLEDARNLRTLVHLREELQARGDGASRE